MDKGHTNMYTLPTVCNLWQAMFWIRIRMFLGLLDPDHQTKIVRKTFPIPTILCLLYDFLSLKNYVNVPSKRDKPKNF
jgi:hypothetical protein